MKPPAFEYVAVESTDAAIAELARHGEDAKLLAGGQSLVPLLNLRLAAPRRLVDLNRVAELDFIEERDGGVVIGAMTRQRTAERSALVSRAVPLLAEALPWVGHRAIRTRGTVGGSLAHADPASEIPAVAVCLEARVTVRGPNGARTIAAGDLGQTYLTTTLAPAEVLSSVWFPAAPAGSGWAWLEFSRRHGDYALVGVAVMVRREGDALTEARVALTGVGGVPLRARAAEALVVGAPLDASRLAAFAEAVRAAVEPPTDIHATGAYRRHLAGVLAGRALQRAVGRADAGGSRP